VDLCRAGTGRRRWPTGYIRHVPAVGRFPRPLPLELGMGSVEIQLIPSQVRVRRAKGHLTCAERAGARTQARTTRKRFFDPGEM
jgi:hypothetical protein